MLLRDDISGSIVRCVRLAHDCDVFLDGRDKLGNADALGYRCELERADERQMRLSICAQPELGSGKNTHTGILSPAQNALCGRVMLYMILPGQVFSISSVWLYSAASGSRPRTMLTVFLAVHLVPKTPDFVMIALSWYCTRLEAPLTFRLAGSEPGTMKEKGKRWCPALKVCEWWWWW